MLDDFMKSFATWTPRPPKRKNVPHIMVDRNGERLQTVSGKCVWSSLGAAKNALHYHVDTMVRYDWGKKTHYIRTVDGEEIPITSEQKNTIYQRLIDEGYVRFVPIDD